MEKNPTLWEDMVNMDEEALHKTFQACAQIDLRWAVDQAKCLSYNVSMESEQSDVLRSFCDAAYEQAMEEGDAETALEALQLCADSPAIDEENSAQKAKRLRETLDTMLQENPGHALGTAILLKVRTRSNESLRAEILDFLITAGSTDHQDMLMTLVRSDGDIMAAEQVEKVLQKVEDIATKKPYQAFKVAREMISECVKMTPEQAKRVMHLTDMLGEDTDVMLSILKHEYHEDVTGLKELADGKKLILPASPTIQ